MSLDLKRVRRMWRAWAMWWASGLVCFGGQSVTLGWLPSSSPQAAGYHLSYGTVSGVYTGKVDAGTNTTFTLTGLTAGQTYYFSATSYDANGTDSAFTPEVSFITPGMLKLSKTTSNGILAMHLQFPVAPSHKFTLQGSSNLISWTNLWATPMETTNGWVEYDETITNKIGSKFYRLVIN